MNDEIPQPDQVAGAPHPRETERLIGQEPAEQAFLDAFNAGRLHHAWLITGPRGVGKATLAWKLARFLLTTPSPDEGGLFGAPEPPQTLDVSPDHPALPRLQALSEPRLYLLRRPWDEKTERLRTEITVDEVRKVKSFFTLSAADGGRRVVIVDSADELNVNAANALLKLLEEPPSDAVILLISHQPSRLLPTIRSRCRTLRCQPLSDHQIEGILLQSDVSKGAANVIALADGSAGAAIRMLGHDGPALYAEILSIFAAPKPDRPRALALADSMTGRANADRFDFTLELIDLFLSRLARTGVTGPPKREATSDEVAILTRLCPHPHAARRWAALQQELSARARHGQAVNLDPAALILDIVLKINETAADLAA